VGQGNSKGVFSGSGIKREGVGEGEQSCVGETYAGRKVVISVRVHRVERLHVFWGGS